MEISVQKAARTALQRGKFLGSFPCRPSCAWESQPLGYTSEPGSVCALSQSALSRGESSREGCRSQAAPPGSQPGQALLSPWGGSAGSLPVRPAEGRRLGVTGAAGSLLCAGLALRLIKVSQSPRGSLPSPRVQACRPGAQPSPSG